MAASGLLSLQAQVSRSRSRSALIYRNYYQRMGGSGEAGQRFSIRDGTRWAAGNNTYGQLGDGSTSNRYSQVRIDTGTAWIAVACGLYHSLVLRTDAGNYYGL